MMTVEAPAHPPSPSLPCGSAASQQLGGQGRARVGARAGPRGACALLLLSDEPCLFLILGMPAVPEILITRFKQTLCRAMKHSREGDFLSLHTPRFKTLGKFSHV